MRALALALATLLAALPAAAQESRVLRPIERPEARAPLPAGAVRLAPFQAVSRERIEKVVAEILAAWGERRLDAVLAEGFYDRERLRDAIEVRVPRDASLRLIAIQGWQVVDQYRIGRIVVSKVSITVRTQLEWQDPSRGLQRREGVNDFLVTLGDRVR